MIRLAVIFGSRSFRGAAAVLESLSPQRYEAMKIGITEDGSWFLYNGPLQLLERGKWMEKRYLTRAMISHDRNEKGILTLHGEDDAGMLRCGSLNIDCLLPVLGGGEGADGTLQGLLELSGIPFAGSGHMAGSVCADVSMTRAVAAGGGIPCGNWMAVARRELPEVSSLAARMGMEYPLSVCAAAPSFGEPVRVDGESGLPAALERVLESSPKAVVEEFINAPELVCSILGGDPIRVSPVGMLDRSQGEEAVFIPEGFPEKAGAEVQGLAQKMVGLAGCRGLSLCRFQLCPNSGVLFRGLHAAPDFSKDSAAARLWKAAGLDYPGLLDAVISGALDR